MAIDDTHKQMITALIRCAKMFVSLLEKIRKGEKI